MTTAANAPTRQSCLPWLIVLGGLLVMYGPSFFDLFRGLWSSSEQGHGPIVLGISVWLLYRAWPEVSKPDALRPCPAIAWPLIASGALCYVLGRSQDILIFEVGSLIPTLAGLVLLFGGVRQLRTIWFALFFMLFMIPLPGALVDALTQPMKLAVSHVAEQVLFALDYPIARTGVMLQIGPYQLLVADACAGLHTLFTLESLGLLYLNLVRHSSLFRNTALAILIVPISFCANVIRVIVLTLVTYHFGDEAGQGFLHGFAGMVLFISALLLIVGVDSLLRLSCSRRPSLNSSADAE
ncbi:exosortase B [Niveibacterium terrae]|uniref:exosortase B n=1 Tax=Niveibacterium terrae TaxID=3373598 RepID=UPI003A931E66